MAKQKKGLLPKIELMVIAVFGVCFLLWAVPRCASIMSPPEQESEPETTTIATPQDTVAATSAAVNTSEAIAPAMIEKTVTKEVSALYITINNLKVRREPDLQSDVIKQLPLFEKVFFMGEVTDSLYEINLGYETAKEPWVKVRTQKGVEGWVYGAGVNYYKKKRSGVLE